MIFGSWRGDFTMVCNTEAMWNGISAGVCTKWHAAANIAYTTGSRWSCPMRMRVLPLVHTLPTYQTAPPPDYLLLQPAN